MYGVRVFTSYIQQCQLNYQEPRIIPIHCDLGNWEATRKAVESAGPIHLLVNNAAVATETPFLEVTQGELNW